MGLFLEANIADNFMIKGVLKMPFKFLGGEVWITDSIISMWLVSLIIVGFAIVCNLTMKKATRENKIVPSGFQNFVEMIVDLIDNMAAGTLGSEKAKSFRNYIGTIFIFILLANLSGLLGLHSPTADYGVTFPLGIFTFYDIFKKVINKLNIPIANYWNAIDLIENENLLYVGRDGNMGDRAVNFEIQNSDLLINIGSRLSIRQTGYDYKTFATDAKIVMIDIDKEEFKKPNIKSYKTIWTDPNKF